MREFKLTNKFIALLLVGVLSGSVIGCQKKVIAPTPKESKVVSAVKSGEEEKNKRLKAPAELKKKYFLGISPSGSVNISEDEWANYKEIGVKSLRIHIQLNNLGYNQAFPNFKKYDAIVARAKAEDIEVVLLLSYESYKSVSEEMNKGWGPILNFQKDCLNLVPMVQMTIMHFKDSGVKKYEIWNEENGMWNETISDSKSFQIVDYVASDSVVVKQQGLIEINSHKQYFQYRDSKKDFYPVGYQLPWSWPKTFQNYEENAIKMAENGGNFTRIWGSGIEQTMSVENKNYGVGRYQINNAQAQDLVLDMFRQKGIKVEYAFDSFNSFQSAEQWYGEWKNNPYNSANSGGFLSKPVEFFTSEKAISLYEQKLRYCIARWGWDANLAIWEIMNEIDGVEPFYTNKADIILWIDEIAKYIKSTDYYKRPVAMSFAKAEGHPGINSLNSIDLVTVHFYNQNDIASAMSNFIKTSSTFGKPVVVGEFGPDSGDFDRCRNGVNLQEGIWSSIASGSANVAQYWWWDELINPDSLYVQMDPISRFVASFEFSKEKLNDLPATSSVTQMRALGRINEGKTRGLIWIQNKNNLWKSIAVNGKAPSLNNVTLTVSAANGDYEVYEWDTWAKGKAPIKTIMTVSDGKLVLIINNLEIDRAFTFSKR